MDILKVCCKNKAELDNTATQESWVKVFQKMKDYLLVSICDSELCEDSLVILHNFLTADSVKHAVYEETKDRDIFVQSIKLLYEGDQDFCKDKFR